MAVAVAGGFDVTDGVLVTAGIVLVGIGEAVAGSVAMAGGVPLEIGNNVTAARVIVGDGLAPITSLRCRF